MGDRAVYCARLESVCAERHRGFESPPIRPASRLRSCSLAFLDHMQFLSQLHPASMRQDAAEIYARVNHAIAADN